MKGTKVSKTTLVSILVVLFFPVMLVGAIRASIKVAYKFGYAMATDCMKGI